MNKRFTKLIAALALLVFMTPSLAGWGQTREEVADVLVATSFAATSTTYTDFSDVTFTSDAVYAGNSAKTSNGGIQLRSKNSNSGIVSTTSGGTIHSVSITVESGSNTLDIYGKNTAYTSASDLYSSQTQGTKIGSISATGTVDLGTNVDQYAYIGIRSNNGAIYLTDITVTWTTSGGTPTPTCATPTFDPAGGTYTEAQTVSISCETDGATIYYTTDGTAPDNNSAEYTGAITVSETMTIKAIAYVGTDASTVASATYTILTLMTIAEARAQGTGVVYTSGTVTSCVGTTGYIQDASAAICVYGASLTVGDNITVQGSLTTYNGLLEIANPVVNVISSGNTIEPEVMTIADINANTNQGWYVRIENATVTEISGQNTTIAQDQNTIVVRGISGVEYQVNDIISLNGNIGCFNDVAQIANPQNVTVQESEDPAILVEPTTINVPCAATEGTLTVTYQNIEEELGAEIYWYESDGTTSATYDWVMADFNENGNIDYIIDANTSEARTAYMKVYGIGTNGNDAYSELITFSQGHYISDYATLPFEFDGGKADIEGTSGLTQEGLGSDYSSSPKLKFDGTGDWLILHFNEQPGTLTFDIKGNSFSGGTFTVQTSEDGETYTDLETYTELGSTQSESFDNLGENVRYIKWIYTEKSNGNVALGNITLAKYVEPVLVPSITVTPELVEVDAAEHEGTLGLAYENLEISDMNDFIVVYFDNQGGSIDDPDWIEVSVAEQDSQIGEGYVVSYYMLENVGEARSAFFKVIAADGEDFVYSNLVTVNQAAYVAPVTGDKYVKVASADDLTDGQYLIVYEDGNLAFNGGLETLDAVDNSISVTISENEIGVTDATAAAEFTIDVTNGTLKSASGKYIGVSSNSNGLKQSDDASTYINSFSIDESGNAVIAAVFDQSNMTLRYNKASNQNRFRYYGSGQEAIQLYKKAEATPAGNQLSITGYGEGSGNWYLIASPVSTTPEAAGMITDDLGAQATPETATYDLYYYYHNAEDGLEWRNYRTQTFNLTPGTGYLYANKNDVTLTFTGTAYEGDGSFNLVSGWNLVGNPFAVTAYIGRNFYTMNPAGSELIACTTSNDPIEAMHAVFVEGGDEDQVTFSTTAPDAKSQIVALNLRQNRGTAVDRAIVRFDEGQQLPKFQLNPESTKLYIAQGNKDYAIVRSAAQGEMPVSFRASENGTYTLSIETENVEMDYLHLIDNMTGMDVDLLQTPSYSFEAKTTDYASRFRLVFSANGIDEQNAETFAFFNGSEWVVGNTGEATLQVVDVMGRVLSTETISGNAELSLNQPAGVYMLRLINGNDVKVQKVVVR